MRETGQGRVSKEVFLAGDQLQPDLWAALEHELHYRVDSALRQMDFRIPMSPSHHLLARRMGVGQGVTSQMSPVGQGKFCGEEGSCELLAANPTVARGGVCQPLKGTRADTISILYGTTPYSIGLEKSSDFFL